MTRFGLYYILFIFNCFVFCIVCCNLFGYFYCWSNRRISIFISTMYAALFLLISFYGHHTHTTHYTVYWALRTIVQYSNLMKLDLDSLWANEQGNTTTKKNTKNKKQMKNDRAHTRSRIHHRRQFNDSV